MEPRHSEDILAEICNLYRRTRLMVSVTTCVTIDVTKELSITGSTTVHRPL